VNISGGKWIIRLRKGVADRLWEDLILAIIGDQFDECNVESEDNPSWEESNGSGWPEICGCTISVRQSEDIVTLWNRVDGDLKLREKIRCVALKAKAKTTHRRILLSDRETFQKVLNLPSSTIMEYKSNNGQYQ
jgi:translation initiation factor 4E